jgi:hypothetical protein
MAFVFLGLGVQTFFSKKKSFPETRISRNKEMKKRKIYCAETQQAIIDKKNKGTHNNCSACY